MIVCVSIVLRMRARAAARLREGCCAVEMQAPQRWLGDLGFTLCAERSGFELPTQLKRAHRNARRRARPASRAAARPRGCLCVVEMQASPCWLVA